MATALERRRFLGSSRNKSPPDPDTQFILFVRGTQAIDAPLCDCVTMFPCDYVFVLLCYRVDSGIYVDLGLARRNARSIVAT